MTDPQVTPVAEHLLGAFLERVAYSRAFRDDHGQPPTLAAKVHHMRSIIQARIVHDDRYSLSPLFVETGRVEIEDRETGDRYLLRSESTVTIERFKGRQKEALFDSTKYLNSNVLMLIYKFHKQGLDLSLAGTRFEIGKIRLEATGVPTFLGTWLFSMGAETFDQDDVDGFEDLRDLDEPEEGDGK